MIRQSISIVSKKNDKFLFGRLGRLAVTVLLNLALLLAVAGRVVGPTRPISGAVHGPAGFYVVTVNNWGWDFNVSLTPMSWDIFVAPWPENVEAFTAEEEHVMTWFAGFYWLKNPTSGGRILGVEHWLVFSVLSCLTVIHHRRRILNLVRRRSGRQ